MKDVLQSLVDDGLVQADKIGSSNCMYALNPHALNNIDVNTRCSFLELSLATGSKRISASPLVERHLNGRQVRARLSKANNITDSINNQLKDTKAVIESEQALRKHSVCNRHRSSMKTPNDGIR